VVALGFTLQPEDEFLRRCDRILRAVDYFEIAPETTWYETPDGELRENGFSRRFNAIAEELPGRFFVAHGVGFSLGTASRRDAARRRRWLDRVALDHARFRFRWYTDHLGASSLDGAPVTLPLPLPMTAESARVVRARLADLQTVVPRVGVENSVSYFLLGAPLDEARFLDRVVAGARVHLLLDLHNLYTMSVNFGFDTEDYLRQLNLSKVIEVHLSGGADSDGAWLLSGRVMRLDSHDAAIPDEVWRLAERVLPRCPNLRGVTVERMEGTVSARDVAPLAAEVRRARRLVEKLR